MADGLQSGLAAVFVKGHFVCLFLVDHPEKADKLQNLDAKAMDQIASELEDDDTDGVAPEKESKKKQQRVQQRQKERKKFS